MIAGVYFKDGDNWVNEGTITHPDRTRALQEFLNHF